MTLWRQFRAVLREMGDELQPERIAARIDAWVAKEATPDDPGWWRFDRLPRRNARPPPPKEPPPPLGEANEDRLDCR